MAVSNRIDGHPLPCGRLVEDVFDDLDAGRSDDHSTTCEHCVTARRSLDTLTAATRALIDDVAEPPSNLLDRIMAAVRAEVRRGDVLPLGDGGFGPVDISEQAVAAVLRYAADTVDGVWARSCHVSAEAGRAVTVTLSLSLSLRFGAGPAERLVDHVRERLAAALAGQVGLRAGRIDLRIEDVWPEEER